MKPTRWAGRWILLAWLAVAIPAGAQPVVELEATARVIPSGLQIEAQGELVFPDAGLGGEDAVLMAGQSPTFLLIDARGDASAGWHVTLTASDLSDPQGERIPATLLRCSATGGKLERLAGLPVDSQFGPAETGLEGALSSGLKVVFADPGFGRGSYTYQPAAFSFQLTVPASASPGTYRGLITADLVAGP
ncbi:MAG: hypothetical protein HY319_31420 [Armatimonadetes bacterium]|nr:hypothetical protein [Armatimonadota bacterium]